MSSGVNDTTSALAANLRRLRIARHLSLSELARVTGIAKATLSQVENGRANPTVATLTEIARVLEVRPGELLDGPALGDVRVVRAHRNAARASRRLEASGGVEVRELRLPARRTRAAAAEPAGAREAVYVLEGTLVAGPVERITELTAGDYASFPADVERSYEAGRGAARALVITRAA